MKILRHHKGFTTNSSSSSEWVTPGMSATTLPDDAFDAQGNLIDTNQTTAASTNAAQTNAVTEVDPDHHEALNQNFSNNLIMIGGFICAILGIFAVERLLRKVLKKPAAPEDH